jgi:hypothetical protein
MHDPHQTVSNGNTADSAPLGAVRSRAATRSGWGGVEDRREVAERWVGQVEVLVDEVCGVADLRGLMVLVGGG